MIKVNLKEKTADGVKMSAKEIMLGILTSEEKCAVTPEGHTVIVAMSVSKNEDDIDMLSKDGYSRINFRLKSLPDIKRSELEGLKGYYAETFPKEINGYLKDSSVKGDARWLLEQLASSPMRDDPIDTLVAFVKRNSPGHLWDSIEGTSLEKAMFIAKNY